MIDKKRVREKLKKRSRLIVLLVFLPAIFTSFFPNRIITISILSFGLILWFVLNECYKNKFINKEVFNSFPIYLYIFSSFIIFFTGLVSLNSKNDLAIFLGNIVFITLLFPLLLLYFSINRVFYQLRSIFFIGLPLALITFFKNPTDAQMSFQHNIQIIALLVIFFPILPHKWKIVVLILVFFGLSYDITKRSFLINMLISTVIMLLGFFVRGKSLKIVGKILFPILISLPIFLLLLGLFGVFNIFTYSADQGKNLKVGDREATVDSRTSIYYDVFSELNNKNKFMFGLGGNGKTKTTLTDISYANYDIIYKDGRPRTESGMLNYFQWGGIFGAFCYWFLYAYAGYNAIFRSANKYTFLLGIFILFKLVYSFIEESIMCSPNTFYNFLFLSIAYNERIISMKGNEMKNYLHKVLSF